MRSTCRAAWILTERVMIKNSARGKRKMAAMKNNASWQDYRMNPVVSMSQDSIHYSFIHLWFKWFTGNTEQTHSSTSETKQVIIKKLQSDLNSTAWSWTRSLPGGWQFLTLWHPESQTGQHTSWCLCLPVETLRTVKYIKQRWVLMKKIHFTQWTYNRCIHS